MLPKNHLGQELGGPIHSTRGELRKRRGSEVVRCHVELSFREEAEVSRTRSSDRRGRKKWGVGSSSLRLLDSIK